MERCRAHGARHTAQNEKVIETVYRAPCPVCPPYVVNFL